jgi:hypothetical protein
MSLIKNSYLLPFLFSSSFLLLIAGCNKGTMYKDHSEEGDISEKNTVLLFNSGFESGSKILHGKEPFTSDDDIVGKDLSAPSPNDWDIDIDKSNNLGQFNLQYQGGDTTMRTARIIPEPGNPENHVLHFWLNQANVGKGSKGRIQANIYESQNNKIEGIKKLYQSVKLFLHEDMEVVKSYPNKISWLTILEVWNNIQWIDDPFPYRLTVGIGKPSSESRELHFMVDAEDYEYATESSKGRYVKIWHEMNTDISVPIGSWVVLDYYLEEGDGQNGRFYMAMTPEGGEKQVIFDIRNFTHNTKDPNPDGITLWNPMKLYTSKGLVNYVRSEGKALQVYWDDFIIRKLAPIE